MSRNRSFCLVLAIALAASTGCSGDDDTAESTQTPSTPPPTDVDATSTVPTTTTAPSTTSTSTTSQPTTTTAPSTTSTSPPTTAATTVSGEPDWFEIVSDLSSTLDEVTSDPDPSRIGEFAALDGTWASIGGSGIRNMHEAGQRIVGLEPTEVVSVDFEGTLDDRPVAEAGLVTLRVTTAAPDLSDAHVVDADGEIVYDLTNETEPGDLREGIWILVRTEDGWRIEDIRS